jgi:hypothetical protein
MKTIILVFLLTVFAASSAAAQGGLISVKAPTMWSPPPTVWKAP